MFDALPEAFGSYRVLEAIGPGRFGPVYRAREDATGLDVAIKVFDQGLSAAHAERVASMLARLAQASLNHPAIVPVLTAGVNDDHAWLAEPWFDAVPLESLMQRVGQLRAAEALLRLTKVAAALDFAAAVGIHHGALHPRDVLVSQELTAVAGLGVLQALGEAGLSVPLEGAYVSPQRTRGLPVTAADDVYALAAMTSVLVDGPSGQMADVLERALSPDPGERPLTALALVAAVQDAASHVPAAASAMPGTPVRQPDAEVALRHAHPDERAHGAGGEIPIRPVDAPPSRLSELSLRSPAAEPHAVATAGRYPDPHQVHQSHSVGLWVTAALAIGILGGFAGGYIVGQRDATPVPHSAARPAARDQVASGAPQVEVPAPTAGRDYTDSPVTPPAADGPSASRGDAAQPVQEPAVIPTPESAGRPAAPPAERPNQPEGARPAPSEPGSLHVDSRPRGARVFLDGRLMGTTPVVVSDVPPGTHAVRIDLQGHRRWVTSVEVAPGERHRVAASLER